MRRSKRQSAHRQATPQVDHVTLDGQRDIDGGWRFFEDPPLLTRVDAETEKKVVGSLVKYCETMPLSETHKKPGCKL
jgi:hypothetical protein